MSAPTTVALVGLVGALLLAAPAVAAPPFVLPADCTLGRDCWVVRYVDRMPGAGLLDVGCGTLTGEEHQGTDIAVRDLAVLAEGVRALSPGAGRVVGVRDGMPDVAHGSPGAPTLDGRNCGNGVRIDHGDGWVSQLCHLRRGSLLVADGDDVDAGQPVGRLGLSGETTFPHVHWSLWHEERLVDPFDGASVETAPGCPADGDSLLVGAPDYLPLPLVGVGFAPAAPEDTDIARGWHRETSLPSTVPALVLWAHAYGTQAEDSLHFVVEGPEGPVVDRVMGLERGHARGSYFSGARRPDGGWPSGRYVGTVTWSRGEARSEATVELELEAPR